MRLELTALIASLLPTSRQDALTCNWNCCCSCRALTMQMHKLGYFAEFVVFQPLVIGLSIVAFRDSEPLHATTWMLSFAFGVVLWTLLEYLLHRFIFHHAPIISEIHEQHHDDPMALIGAPAWTGFVLALLGVLFPLWLLVGLSVAAGITAGVICGYLWYVL